MIESARVVVGQLTRQLARRWSARMVTQVPASRAHNMLYVGVSGGVLAEHTTLKRSLQSVRRLSSSLERTEMMHSNMAWWSTQHWSTRVVVQRIASRVHDMYTCRSAWGSVVGVHSAGVHTLCCMSTRAYLVCWSTQSTGVHNTVTLRRSVAYLPVWVRTVKAWLLR